MAVEVTYDQYAAAGGRASETAFNDQLPRAVACVDFLIGPNEVTDEEAYRRAVWAALGAYLSGNTAGSGFSIGSFRMDGAGSQGSLRANARRAAYEVLAPSGMVWAGLA